MDQHENQKFAIDQSLHTSASLPSTDGTTFEPYCNFANNWRDKYRIFRNGSRAERANFLKWQDASDASKFFEIAAKWQRFRAKRADSLKWQESAKYRNLKMAEKSPPFIRKFTVVRKPLSVDLPFFI